MSRTRLLMPLSTVAMLAGFAGFLTAPSDPMIRVGSLMLSLLVVGITSWSISDRPGRDPLDMRIVDAMLIAMAFMVLTVLLLGSFGLLGWWMLVVSAGMAGSMWAMIDRRTAFDRQRTSPGRVEIGLVAALPIGFSAFAFVQAVLGRVFRPPVGDSLAYHLPFAVEWLQQKTLDMPIPAAGDPSTPFYPLNSAAWIYWLLAPLESEILARFVQLPFLLLLGLAVFRLAADLDLPSQASAMAAAIAVSVPAIARSASIPENDLIMAALLITATAFLIRLGREFMTWRAGMFALVIGLAVGTKVIALGFAALLGLVWIVLVFRTRWSSSFWRVLRLLLSGVAIVLLFGGYSYLRNAVMMGNPLYPAGYELPGDIVLKGLYFPTWEWRQAHVFFAFDWEAFLNGSRRDFGWTVTAWAIPGIILATLVSLTGMALRSRSARDVQGLIPVIWVGISLAIFWYVIPYHFSRFLFPTIVMSVVAGMWALGRLATAVRILRIEVWYPLLAVPIIGLNLINIPLDPAVRYRALYWVAAGVVIVGMTMGLLILRWIPPRALRIVIQVAAMSALLGTMVGWPVYQDEYEDRRIREWRAQIQGFSLTSDAWEWIEGKTANRSAVIAVAGTNEIYPFYGPNLGNRIVTIWNSGELAEYGWFEPFVLYGEQDRAAWQDEVETADVRFIVLTENVSFGGWPEERSWIMASPERYKLEFSNTEVEIWEVLEPATETARYTVREELFNTFDWHDY
jgi:hypothetical protein